MTPARTAVALAFVPALLFGGAARADQIRGPGVAVCDDAHRALVGHVVAVSGDVSAAAEGCPPRALACDASVYAGDGIRTGTDARVAFQADELYVQLAPDSEIQLARTAEGAPDLTLLRGRGRAIDQQLVDVGPAHRIATPQAESLARGNDTEAFAHGDAASAESGLCEWATPIEVKSRTGGAGTTLHPGECVGWHGASAPAATAGAALGVSLADVASCEIASNELTPIDVAGGPPIPGFPLEPPPVAPPPLCVAGACGSGPPPTHIPVVESPAGFEPPP